MNIFYGSCLPIILSQTMLPVLLYTVIGPYEKDTISTCFIMLGSDCVEILNLFSRSRAYFVQQFGNFTFRLNNQIQFSHRFFKEMKKTRIKNFYRLLRKR